MTSCSHVVHSCPHCGAQNDHAKDLNGDARPTAGDISICFTCAALAIFQEDGTTRLPTEEEYEEALRDAQVVQAMASIRALRSASR